MNGFNSVQLMGNLTRDPQLKTTQNGNQVCGFGIAVSKQFKDSQGNKQTEVTFVDCNAWGNMANTIAQYLKKGSPIFITGELRQETWQDQQTGQNRSKLSVTVRQMRFVGYNKEQQQQQQNQQWGNAPQQPPQKQWNQQKPPQYEPIDGMDEPPF